MPTAAFTPAGRKRTYREWFIRCEHCGHRQFLTIDHFVTEWDTLGRPSRWHGDSQPYAACEKCGDFVDRLAAGEWVATNPAAETVGFHLTKLFSPLTNPLKVIRALQTSDETARREAYNQDLGEPFTPAGGQLTDEVLDKCLEPYTHEVRPHVRTVAGVDVGKVLHCVIRVPAYGNRARAQVWAGVVDSWEELGRLFYRYRVRSAVIDAMPEGTKAHEFQRKIRGVKIFVAYYVGQAHGSTLARPVGLQRKRSGGHD